MPATALGRRHRPPAMTADAPQRLAAGVARAAMAVALVTVAARIVGFARTVVLAATVGDSGFLGNTYAAANTVPNILFEVVAGGALASLVVPVLAGAVQRGEADHVRRTASGLLTWTVLVLTPIALAGALLARPLMGLLVLGVDDPVVRAEQVDLGARMLVVFMPQVVLYGAGIVLAGVLQAHRRFVGPALAPLLSSLVVIAAYVQYAAIAGSGRPGEISQSEELVLSIGTTLGVAALSLSLLVPASRLALRLRPTLRLPEGVGAQVRRLALAGGAGIAAQQVALLVALVVTNSRPGAVIAYQLAYTVFLLPWGVLAVPLATGAFPALAAAADDDPASYTATLSSAARSMVAVCAGATAALWAVHRPVAFLLPYHPAAGTEVTGRAAVATGIAVLVLGLVPYGLLALLTRALFARGRNLAAGVSTVSGFAVAAALSALLGVLDPDRPVRAVAIGHSAGMAVSAVLLVLAVRRDTGPPALRGLRRTATTCSVAAVAAAGIGRAVAHRIGLPDGRAALVAAAVGVGLLSLATYAVVLRVLRSPELDELSTAIAVRARRG
ncbi:MAG TPA: lipid II flippase MurJ [Mycobacteriales bacterium]|nr:lipid II flippase MurJ [Mycobacteriales bacterium]